MCRSLRYNGNIDGDAKQLLRSSAATVSALARLTLRLAGDQEPRARRRSARWPASAASSAGARPRIAKHMRLDKDMWADFVWHANAHYKSASSMRSRALRLVCRPGRQLACGFRVDLTSFSADDRLGLLHLDHGKPGRHMHMWRRALPNAHRTGDGIRAGLLCHLLFSVAPHPRYGAPMLRVPAPSCCHQLNMPHYGAWRCGARPRTCCEM